MTRRWTRRANAKSGLPAAELAGVFLLAAATLLLETTLCKVFAVTMWSSLAFMIVSTALFGIGLAGVVAALPGVRRQASGASPTKASACHRAVRPELALTDVLRLSPHACSLGFALSTIGCLLVINIVPLDLMAIYRQPIQLGYLAIYYLALVIPFFCSGMTVALLLARRSGAVGFLYGFDLLGAGLGCLLMIPLMPWVGGAGTLVAAAAMGAAGAFCFGFASLAVPGARRQLPGWGRVRFHLAPGTWRLALSLLTFIGLLALTPLAEPLIGVRVHVQKRAYQQDRDAGRIIYSHWSPITRIDVADRGSCLFLHIDCGTNSSSILPFDGDWQTLPQRFDRLFGADYENTKALDSVTLPYRLRPGARALIIGPSGGKEVLGALANGARAVTGVELDPTICDLVRGRFARYTGGLFQHPAVRLVNDEGRSYLRGSRQRFDVIQEVNNFTPVAILSGALSLAETYLVTEEAFEDYLDHLTPGGLLAIHRNAPIRLLAVALAAMEKRGIPDPDRRVVIIQPERWHTMAFLLKNGAFTEGELDAIDAYTRRRHFQVVYSPRLRDSGSLYAQLVHAHDRDQFCAAASFNIAPVTDDRPFFNRLRKGWWVAPAEPTPPSAACPADIREVLGRQPRRLPIPIEDLGLWAVGLEAAVLSLLFIVAPLWSLRSRARRSALGAPREVGPLSPSAERRAPSAAFLAYFGALGLGFILVELCLMQKFVLFIGYPVYAVATVLCALLVSAGMGSLLTARWHRPAVEAIARVVAAICVVLAADLTLLPAIFHLFLGQSVGVRAMIAFFLLCPTGLLLGMPFPLGIRAVEETVGQSCPDGTPQSACARLIPWLWGINGYMTVVGSVASVVLAIQFGFSATLLVAAGVYALGGLAVARSARRFDVMARSTAERFRMRPLRVLNASAVRSFPRAGARRL